jgi:hypothetical protein
MQVPKVIWTATGGKIDGRGGFTAGSDEGEFQIEAVAGDVSVQTMVLIAKAAVVAPPPQRTEKFEIRGLRWSGEVPAQKWMNLYTKVLSKFATQKGLGLTVTFEVRPDGGLLPPRVEETKASLRELGLDDDVEAVQ